MKLKLLVEVETDSYSYHSYDDDFCFNCPKLVANKCSLFNVDLIARNSYFNQDTFHRSDACKDAEQSIKNMEDFEKKFNDLQEKVDNLSTEHSDRDSYY